MVQYNIYALFQVVLFVKYSINVPVESLLAQDCVLKRNVA